MDVALKIALEGDLLVVEVVWLRFFLVQCIVEVAAVALADFVVGGVHAFLVPLAAPEEAGTFRRLCLETVKALVSSAKNIRRISSMPVIDPVVMLSLRLRLYRVVC